MDTEKLWNKMCADRRKAHKISVALNREDAPQKAKDVEDCMSG